MYWGPMVLEIQSSATNIFVPEYFCADHLYNEHYCKLVDMYGNHIVGSVNPLLGGAVQPLCVCDMLALVFGVDPNLQQGYIPAVWFKFSFHPQILNAEAALSIACLDLFDDLNYGFDALIFGHQGHDELDVMAY